VARLAPFCLITNRTDDIAVVEAAHRDHAVVEQVIADLKDQALAHFPSGHLFANAAWTVRASSTSLMRGCGAATFVRKQAFCSAALRELWENHGTVTPRDRE
jgi:hypothetical protein